MKLLSYNIHHSSQEKLEKILAFEADVYVLPELSNPSRMNVPSGFESRWIGENERKGLGVLWKSSLDGYIPDWFNPAHQYFLPVIIGGKLILASWPTMTKANTPKSYPQIAIEALREYAPFLKQMATIITGDMNCYQGQAGETKDYCTESIFNFFHEMGFVSAYHQSTGETLGNESAATYYHRFNKDYPFFIDYTFFNMELKSYALCEWDKEISDHVAQVIEA